MPSRSSGSRLHTSRSVRISAQPPSSGAAARYPGVAQHALADAAELLRDLLGGGVVGGGAQFEALELWSWKSHWATASTDSEAYPSPRAQGATT